MAEIQLAAWLGDVTVHSAARSEYELLHTVQTHCFESIVCRDRPLFEVEASAFEPPARLGVRSEMEYDVVPTHCPRETVEIALAHKTGNQTEQAYERGDKFEKRRRLMQSWTDFLGKPVHAGIVTPIGRRAGDASQAR